ncbi:hypothetical protein F5884DRAFT_862757 [Xylogone sp. PMI_703]|nr:hypothetical protein F5884DRAFT_862757 [Xylogone sp. PMI_703]
MPQVENNEAIAADGRSPIIHSQPYNIPNREGGVLRRGPARIIQTFPFRDMVDIYPPTEIDDNECQAENTDPVPPTEVHPALREPRASPPDFATSGRISDPQELPEIDPSTVPDI